MSFRCGLAASRGSWLDPWWRGSGFTAIAVILASLAIGSDWCPWTTASGDVADSQEARTDVYGDPLATGSLARLGTLRFWTSAPISTIAFVPDGKTVAAVSAGYGESVSVWETNTGRLVRVVPTPDTPLPEDFGGLGDFAFSPDGKCMALCGTEAVVTVQSDTGRVLHVLRGQKGGTWRTSFFAERWISRHCGGRPNGPGLGPDRGPRASTVPVSRLNHCLRTISGRVRPGHGGKGRNNPALERGHR